MSELQELYQEIVMEHNRKPRNFRKLEDFSKSADGFNPFCGDSIEVYLKLDGDVITDVGFQGSGCAISRASSSLMTESIKGKRREEADKLFAAFHGMITRGPEGDFDSAELGDLEVLAGVSEFPTRIKCATLSWHTLRGALEERDATVSTE